MKISAGDRVFVDTNVLLCATDTDREQQADAHFLLGHAGRSGIHLLISGQIVREYLVVATRPSEQNGLGLSPRHALENIERITHHIALVEETIEVAKALQRLVKQSALRGKRIHDANLVASMQCHGIATLITENLRDFRAFESIQTLDCAQAVATLQR